MSDLRTGILLSFYVIILVTFQKDIGFEGLKELKKFPSFCIFQLICHLVTFLFVCIPVIGIVTPLCFSRFLARIDLVNSIFIHERLRLALMVCMWNALIHDRHKHLFPTLPGLIDVTRQETVPVN